MSPGQKIDWDFTKMNFNMASGLVFDMMVDPQKYNNKTAKIKGQFSSDVHQGSIVTITGVLEMANLFGQEDLCLVAKRWA